MKWLRITNRLLIIEDPEPAPRSPNKLMGVNGAERYKVVRAPHKIEVYTSSFCSIWFGIDLDTCIFKQYARIAPAPKCLSLSILPFGNKRTAADARSL